MDAKELKEFAEERLQEMEPEVVAETFMKMYLAGKINIDTLAFLIDVCGFELDEKFRTATREEQEKMLEDAKNNEEELMDEDEESEEDEEDDCDLSLDDIFITEEEQLEIDKNYEKINNHIKEIKEVVQQLLLQCFAVDVADAFVRMYLDSKFELIDLEFLLAECGYELTEDFKKSSFDEQKKMVDDYHLSIMNSK